MDIFRQVADVIDSYETIVIFHHIRPDGDCLGSQFGLKHLIERNFIDKRVYVVGDARNTLPFMNFVHDEMPSDEVLAASLGIIVDSSNTQRIEHGSVLASGKFAHILRIDHHRNNEDDLPGMVSRWVNPEYSACAEQIADLAYQLDWVVTKEAATYIYLGMYTDSNRFLYSPRTHTLRLAGFLWDAGAEVQYLHTNLMQTTLADLKLRSYIIDNAKTRGKTIYYYMDLATQKQLGITDPLQAAQPNVLGNIQGYPIWAYFTQEAEDSIRCEFRSIYDIHVREVAVKFGGGGHKNAAGAHISDPKVIDEIIDECNRQIARDLKLA